MTSPTSSIPELHPGPGGERSEPMITWAGRLIVFFGTAHTLGALTLERAASHAGEWFRGDLWGEDFAEMSPAAAPTG